MQPQGAASNHPKREIPVGHPGPASSCRLRENPRIWGVAQGERPHGSPANGATTRPAFTEKTRGRPWRITHGPWRRDGGCNCLHCRASRRPPPRGLPQSSAHCLLKPVPPPFRRALAPDANAAVLARSGEVGAIPARFSASGEMEVQFAANRLRKKGHKVLPLEFI